VTRCLLFTVIIAAQCAASTPEHYTGVVRRQGSGTPVAGVPVTAHVDPSWFDNLRGPVTEVTVASTVTRPDGRFDFALAVPRKRLWFQVLGIPKMIPDFGHSSRILLQDAVLRRPRSDKANVIEVPATFRPRPKSFKFREWEERSSQTVRH
jgi:hypothetical protein